MELHDLRALQGDLDAERDVIDRRFTRLEDALAALVQEPGSPHSGAAYVREILARPL